ncbi:hypothetical protein I302_100687 [Kwoniella bestiolae CBS 10118]|uniref:polynucleotide adenylyltransferase n=1 Tax=Kwoniella bestiolae CBS 10118 TaxID=1296100 RepID=A0A1B9G5U5_9TREE|nr:hypothetical protein I302_04063 [Kwoniella bestiolae CBS 10118]OCF26380.1 hypothetical protein I302_04063 [Kwoniella bestiolae CBS 10118]
MHPGVLHRRFLNDLSTSLFSFVLPLLPTSEELNVKEEVRGLIEKLIKTLEPSARLLSFGSSCNSFGLRNSDMDLVVLIDDPNATIEPGNFVESMASLLERETNFNVKPLPRARIPILKLELAPSPALPFGIACDIGIENRLAIENTRLLLTYATIDPARVRTLVLFLKVWSKRRRINSPYRGTLSSYGFTLMVLYYLVHVKQPPVLPNLQRIMPMRPMEEEEVMLEGRNVYFFDDVETLRREWSSVNFESVGELLIDFFRFFSHDFQFNNSVLSLRAGQLTKESKGWVNDIDVGGLNEMARDRNRLCIEDPFEISYNVARTVTKDGLYTIRGEFMRATRILTQRPDRAVLALAELCRERDDDLHRAPRSASPAPRALSATRGQFTNPHVNNGYRSHSQVPFDRFGAGPMLDAPNARRGQQNDDDFPEYSAQDLWLQSQGSNLGGVGGLGLGFDDLGLSERGGRGRDTGTRGLETPGGAYRGAPTSRRSASAYEGGNGPTSGTISAPLSPHRLYAQLELGKGLQPPSTSNPSSSPSNAWPGYDPRLHASPGMPMDRISGPGPSRIASQSGNSRSPNSAPPAPNGRSQGLQLGVGASEDPLPAFKPFDSTPATLIPPPPGSVKSSIKPPPSVRQSQQQQTNKNLAKAKDQDTPAKFISPSTLLSPANETTPLPGVESLTSSFGSLGMGMGMNAPPPAKSIGGDGPKVVGKEKGVEHPDPGAEKGAGAGEKL